MAYPLAMQLLIDDLLCPICSGYVHPFLEGCPACGAGRGSRFAEVAAAGTRGSIGAAALLRDERTLQSAAKASLAYSLRSLSPTAATDFVEAFGQVAASMPYRSVAAAEGPMVALPAGPGVAENVGLALVESLITVRTLPGQRPIAEIPLHDVLAATPIAKHVPRRDAWAGATLGARRVAGERLVFEGDLLLTFAGSGTWGQVSLGNRRGLLAPSARPGHFAILARWLAILAAAGAEARWQAVGPVSHAADLGLADRPLASGAPPEAVPAGGPEGEGAVAAGGRGRSPGGRGRRPRGRGRSPGGRALRNPSAGRPGGARAAGGASPR